MCRKNAGLSFHLPTGAFFRGGVAPPTPPPLRDGPANTLIVNCDEKYVTMEILQFKTRTVQVQVFIRNPFIRNSVLGFFIEINRFFCFIVFNNRKQ